MSGKTQLLIALGLALALAGCGTDTTDSGTPTGSGADAGTAGDAAGGDAGSGDAAPPDASLDDALAEDGAVGDTAAVPDAEGDASVADVPTGDASPDDAGPDTSEPPPLALHPTVAAAPVDPLAGTGVGSCPVYLEEQCVDGSLRRCEIYDTGAAAFADSPDPLLRRVFLYDRWYDLYGSPDGQTAERVFTGPTPGDMPESTWGALEHFAGWAGAGDAAIWTGVALTADAYRYLQTGTEADYARMEAKVRTLVRAFDVTGIPGYLARHHMLWMDAPVVQTDQHIVRWEGPWQLGNRDMVIENPEQVDGLPAAYFDGLPNADGTVVKGTPMWNGHPSIDQYTGPMVAFPLVWNLLKDEALKARIVTHMTCYLKRLRRIEIINLQQNPDILTALTSYLGGSGLVLDPDDIDLLATDRIVAYYHAGINETNHDTFDRSCPDTVALEPTRVLDAADPAFLVDMFVLAADLQDASGKPSEGQIDHMYAVNVRGGDASHMMHLAAMAYYFTGDEQYRSFLFDELIGNLNTVGVALTMQAFRPPAWCTSWYGDHITYGTHWQLISMLPEGELKTQMIRVMEEEMWQKALHDHGSAKFDVMYASSVPPAMATGATIAAERAALTLEALGGNDGVLDAPRRTYTRPVQSIIDALPEGTSVRCPTEAQRAACEVGGELMGIPLPAQKITFTCDPGPGLCVMADGLCTHGLASEGLPPALRQYADFLWQRNPFGLGETFGVEGQKQSPGRDLSEPYWMARHYGIVQSGAGQVLAWRSLGACE